VTKTGTGTGTVAASPPGLTYILNGTPVTLTAAPNSGSAFVGWSGDASGLGTALVTMNTNKSVTATFNTTNPSPSEVFTGSFSGTLPADTGANNCPFTTSYSGTMTVTFSTNGNGTIIYNYPDVTGTITKVFTGCGYSPSSSTGSGVIEGGPINVTGTFVASFFTMNWSGTRNGNVMTLTGTARQVNYLPDAVVPTFILTKH
jgi:hypothetical protein